MKHSAKFIRLCKKYGVDPDKFETEVLSFEDACKVTGDDPNRLPVVTGIAERHQKRIIADYKLSIIAEGIKNNKKVDYTNNEWKRWPVFIVEADEQRPSGFGLACGDYVGWAAVSFVGVRHCFPEWDHAKFFGEHFLDLHVDHHLYT